MRKLLIIAALCLVHMGITTHPTAFAAPAKPGLKDYLGRWEMEIVNSGTTFRSCFLFLEEGKDGVPQGELVWRWGSPAKFRGPGAVRIDDRGNLVLKTDVGPKPLVLSRVGCALEGAMEQDKGEKFFVFATRGRQDVQAVGTWRMTATSPSGEARGVLRIRDDGQGGLSAEAVDNTGDPIRIESTTLKGQELNLVFVSDAGPTQKLTCTCQIQGDAITGKVRATDTYPEVTVRGERQRQWGKPIQLLPQSGLAGWGPRDPSQKFGWTCENGILTNSPPDVDIVSDAKFQDFKLSLEFKFERPKDKDGREVRSNSGVYLRGRYEVQIADDFGQGVESHGNGAVYARIPQKENATAAPGTWQTYELTLIDHHVTVVLNGKRIIDNQLIFAITGGAIDPYESEPGPLMLQGDHGKIWYRNIVVTPALPPAP